MSDPFDQTTPAFEFQFEDGRSVLNTLKTKCPDLYDTLRTYHTSRIPDAFVLSFHHREGQSIRLTPLFDELSQSDRQMNQTGMTLLPGIHQVMALYSHLPSAQRSDFLAAYFQLERPSGG